MKKRIFWLAGEKSGDLHASMVIKYCRKNHPDWQHFGIGGKRMQAHGFNSIFPFERFNVMGFLEVIKHLLFFQKVEKKISEIFRSESPDLVVLVDYPGLNMRVAKLAKKYRLPVLYYICPQFWAWKHKRILNLKKFTDYVAYILPFEGNYFQELNINARYVGHPISEEIKLQKNKNDFAAEHDLDNKKIWLGFLPGSRDSEVNKMLPQFLMAAKYLYDLKPEIIISQSDSVGKQIFDSICADYKYDNLHICHKQNYEMMKYCDFICATSGTATLETAYLGTPFLICYRTNTFNYFIGRYLIKIKRIGLPNIILAKDIAIELIQNDANPGKIAAVIRTYLNNDDLYSNMQNELRYLHDILGKKSASQEVTALIENLIQNA